MMAFTPFLFVRIRIRAVAQQHSTSDTQPASPTLSFTASTPHIARLFDLPPSDQGDVPGEQAIVPLRSGTVVKEQYSSVI